jgi:carbon-monoxide dehydrogenase medium subunit
MYLPDFELRRPRTVEEAVALIADETRDSAVYMGGTELLLLMKLGLAGPEVLVDCKGVAGLKDLRVRGSQLSIGAAVTHAAIEAAEEVNDLVPELALVCGALANVRVRTAGTLGGNLCFADPHSDPATLLAAIDASVRLVGRHGVRTVGVADLARGPYDAVLDRELLLAVDAEVPDGLRVAYERIVLRERPVVTVAVLHDPQHGWRIAVGGAGQLARRIGDVEDVMNTGTAELGDAQAALREQLRPAEDLDGSEEYKQQLVSVLLGRALARIR